jgi:myo-inositol-1(or 4)-monophosphatase
MSKELEVAISAAKEGGEVLKKYFGELDKVVVKSDKSFQTEADTLSEKKIISIIKDSFPDHTIKGEESGLTNEGSKYVWLIDPLDGTTNFVTGIPFFSVSIALVIDEKPVLGVVYDPNNNQLFEAEVGKGGEVNGQPIKVSEASKLSESMIGYARPGKTKGKFVEVFSKVEPATRTPKILGSMVIHLSYVSSGRLDAAILFSPNPWDFAAGALIVEEAGGKVTDFEGKPWSLDSKNILASNGRIHQELLDILKE